MPGFPSFLRLIFYVWCIYHILFILSPDSGHLSCFHLLAYIHNIAMDIGLHATAFYFGYIPRNGIAGSHSNYVKNCHIVFYSSCTIYLTIYYRECAMVPISLQSHQHLSFFSLFFSLTSLTPSLHSFLSVIANLMGMNWHLIWFWFIFP